jgi:hypothetical protein
MRPVYLSNGAAGAGNWAQIDYTEVSFAVGLFLAFSQDSNLTASVQYTSCGMGPDDIHDVTFTQSTTTVTVTDFGPSGKGHGLITGDTSIISQASTSIAGEYAVTVTSDSAYTITVGTSATVTSGKARAADVRVYNHFTLNGIASTNGSGRASGNFAFPIRGIRLNNTTWVAGTSYLDILQGHGLS